MKKFLFLLFMLNYLVSIVYGQDRVIVLNQLPQLKGDAGKDIVITAGQGCRLGNNPSATGGTGNYFYRWEPASTLTDPTAPNPIANPGKTTTYMLVVTDGNKCTSADEITVTVESSGIEENTQKLIVEVYPNPTDGFLHIRASNCSGSCLVEIFNSLGQRMLFRNLESHGDLNEPFDLSGQPTGLYYVRLVNQKNLIIKPVILR
jgi:hypothetical protein